MLIGIVSAKSDAFKIIEILFTERSLSNISEFPAELI